MELTRRILTSFLLRFYLAIDCALAECTRYEISPRVCCWMRRLLAKKIHLMQLELRWLTYHYVFTTIMCVKLLETAKAALMVQLDYRTVTATTLRFYCVFLCTQSHGRLLYFKHAQRKRRQMKWVLGAPDGTNEDAPAVWCRCRSLYCADLGDVHLIFHRRSRIALKTQPSCDRV